VQGGARPQKKKIKIQRWGGGGEIRDQGRTGTQGIIKEEKRRRK